MKDKCVCDETQFKKIIGVIIDFSFENPETYGYPEVVFWNEKYKTNYCPFCGRKLEDTK